MKIFTSIFLTLFTALSILSGCKKETSNIASGEKCYPIIVNSQNLSRPSDNEETFLNYTFDISGNVKTLNGRGLNGEILSFTFDAKGQVINMKSGVDYADLTKMIIYDNLNRIIRLYNDDYATIIFDFEYNSSNQLIKIKEYDSSTKNIVTYVITLEYENSVVKNPIKIITSKNQNNSLILWYTEYFSYDNQKRPLQDLGIIWPLESIILYGDFPDNYWLAGVNNLTRWTTKDDKGVTTSEDFFTYEYNSKGFPTKINTRSVYYSGGVNSESKYVDTYTYDCK